MRLTVFSFSGGDVESCGTAQHWERERVRALVRSWNSCFILIRYVGKGGCALKVAACNNSLISTGEVSSGTRCCLKWRPKSERKHQKNFILNARMRLIFVVWDFREEKKKTNLIRIAAIQTEIGLRSGKICARSGENFRTWKILCCAAEKVKILTEKYRENGLSCLWFV